MGTYSCESGFGRRETYFSWGQKRNLGVKRGSRRRKKHFFARDSCFFNGIFVLFVLWVLTFGAGCGIIYCNNAFS